MKLRYSFFKNDGIWCIAFYLSNWRTLNVPLREVKYVRTDGPFSETSIPVLGLNLYNVQWVLTTAGELVSYYYLYAFDPVARNLEHEYPVEVGLARAEVEMLAL